MDTMTIRIKGTSPLLMQGDTLANPLHELTKAHKAVSVKPDKTEDDLQWLLWSEWSAGMYYDDEIGPYIPAMNMEGCLFQSAKIRRLGAKVKQAVQVVNDKAKLEYVGPRNKEKMWASNKFSDVRGVKIKASKLMRCRAIFLNWSADFQIAFMEDVLDRDNIIRIAEDAGRRIGIGTYRPRFGRFEVSVLP